MLGRITNRSMATGSLTNLQASLARSQKLQEQMSSGNILTKPSDDPVVTNNSMQYRTEIGVNEQYGRNNADGQAWLAEQEDALTGSVTALQRIRDLTVQAANTGANDPSARKAAAIEVETLRDEILKSANREYLGRPVFAGTEDTGTAYAKQPDGSYAYLGNTEAVKRRVGASVDVTVNTPGPAASTFAALTELAAKLRGTYTGTESISKSLDHVDAALDRAKDGRSSIGARTNQLTSLQDSSEARVDSLTASLTEIEKIDLPKTIIDYQLQDTAYQTALSVTAKVIQPTLMDFLR
jgi:flagellar hook-associated protein 3 FlgL